jgi:hypothetical protein
VDTRMGVNRRMPSWGQAKFGQRVVTSVAVGGPSEEPEYSKIFSYALLERLRRHYERKHHNHLTGCHCRKYN